MSAVPAASMRERLRTVAVLGRRVPGWLRWGVGATWGFTAVAGAASAYGLKLLIDGAVTGDAQLALVGVWLTAVATGVSDAAGRSYIDLKAALDAATGHELEVSALRSVVAIPSLEHLERPEHHDQIALIRSKGRQAASTFTGALDAAQTAVQLGLSVLLLATVDPLLILLPLFAVPSVLLVPRAQTHIRQADEASTEGLRAVDHLHGLYSEVDAAMEMRVLGASGALDDRADELWRAAADRRLHGHIRAASVSAAGFGSVSLGYVLALALVALRASASATVAGDMLLVIQLASRLRGQLDATTGLFRQFKEAGETIDRLIWLRDYQPQGFTPTPSGHTPPSLSTGIHIEGVTFRYPGTDADVLRDIDVTLPAGSTVALVGPNGAGKTTFVKLLCGFYRPTTGRILIDEQDLTDLPPSDWHACLSAAFQDYLRLEDSFRRSIVPGADEHVSDDAIRAAAQRGDALELTTDWPDGFATHLGKTYRDGQQLSGGQWQRVAVARAMYPQAPLVLLLDEPTASVDPEAEHRLYAHYTAAAKAAREHGGVTLLISHRFSSVRMADLTVVLENGRITEMGDHDTLIQLGGTYASMYQQQADAYR